MSKAVVGNSVLIVKADAEFASLPGIDQFVARMKAPLAQARLKNAEGTVEAWNIIRGCYEFGNSAEVQARLTVLNLNADGTKKTGRPHSGHRLAMEAISAKIGCSLRTLERWQLRWIDAAEKLKLSLHATEKEFSALIASHSKDLPGWLESLDKEPEENGSAGTSNDTRPDPEEVAETAFRSVMRKAELNGRINPAVVHGLVIRLAPVFEANGYTISKSKKGGNYK